ncbi:TNF receptor-associated factor homolog 1b-like isoform X2 [Impatiens glandulifera]|uniref:TNF receptor-associated factor homolog 1b-like isoform X2 n=1 Tax=Impatiens glandulifera TaxID=253017 RepID=UPI001FB16F61|nr:TNF receptor-associated factor homolog 1b-like isoform X2 [Impatiens glandulifera]
MAGIVSEESGRGSSFDEILGVQQHCQTGEGSAEWRSCELDEEAGPLFSPAYWDSDDDDDDFGLKASDLYGKFTWKIENFSQINKRDLRSRVFQIGGYEWYILIYPQGCDVRNHLSLFLCVANHDKLLPGWSHFAQFTITVVNKETKKSKFSDTLHRFWKKEHDWGWKKFVELSKVLDAFINDDTLIIKARVQVIRERVDKPFRCLDPRYRRILLQLYLSNVDQIFRRFVEERRSKLVELKEDKMKWSSFCAFWMEIDDSSKSLMSREKSDTILRMMVKHFFVEKEVSSTLVMDCLHSGLKFIEDHAMNKEYAEDLMYPEELPVPLVLVDNDAFVLVDDILVLLERASMESLPPKGDNGHLNRTKDGDLSEELNHDVFYYEEIRLTEIGRRTIEIFALSHIFSKIEVAYQEAVSLKRQEELIREEEAACLAEAEQRAKRGAAEKDKKSKKKQGKQKRNSRKGKDKGKVERYGLAVEDKFQQCNMPDEIKDIVEESELGVGEISDASDSLDCVFEILPPDSEDRDDSPINSVHPLAEATNGGTSSSIQSLPNWEMERTTIPSLVDDSSVTCSTDPAPSILNGHFGGDFIVKQKIQRSPNRRNKRGELTRNEISSDTPPDLKDSTLPNNPSGSCNEPEPKPEPEPEPEPEAVLHGLPEQTRPNQKTDKEEEIPNGQIKPRIGYKAGIQRFSEPKAAEEMISSENRFPEDMPFAHLLNPGQTMVSKPPYYEVPHLAGRTIPSTCENPPLQRVPVAMSRPLTASTVTTTPPPARLTPTISPGPTSTSQSYFPRSYMNAIVGGSVPSSSFIPPMNSDRFARPFGMQNNCHQWIDPIPVDNTNNFHIADLPKTEQTETVACSSGRKTDSVTADEFPHLDIIIALLEDENGSGKPDDFHYQHLNRNLSFSGPIGFPNQAGPSNISCRFEQPQIYYGDGLRRYGSFGEHIHYPRGMDPFGYQNIPGYVNGHVDGLVVPNSWEMGVSDIPYFRMTHLDGSHHHHHRVLDYSNLACSVNGYGNTMFHPSSSNGH